MCPGMNKTSLVALVFGIGTHQFVAHAQDAHPQLQVPSAMVASVLETAGPNAQGAPGAEEALLLGLALRDRVSIARNRSGDGVPTPHCRNASEGCDRRMQVFAGYMADAARARGLDPFLLGAMAVRESMLDPFAVGGIGELGILQINPRRSDAKQVRFMRDGAYRKRCRGAEGACQREIVEHAARILDQAMKACRGQLRAALGAYNSGRCGKSADYAARVLKERARLHAFARATARSPERLARLRNAGAVAAPAPILAGNAHHDVVQPLVSATREARIQRDIAPAQQGSAGPSRKVDGAPTRRRSGVAG
jgi:hypothetical protein